MPRIIRDTTIIAHAAGKATSTAKRRGSFFVLFQYARTCFYFNAIHILERIL
tara:strand:+ start:577 stop:732 length:156 start_codon:yes stop_codon:yes gene_type:complete